MFLSVILIGILSVVIYFLYFTPSKRLISKSLQNIPTVPFTKWPLLGNGFSLLRGNCYPWEEIAGWLERYANDDHLLKFEFMSQTFLLIGNIKLVQYILGSHHLNYIKDSKTFAPFRDLLGSGLVTSEGKQWERQRKFLAPAFRGREALRHVAFAAVEATHRMVENFEQKMSDGNPLLVEWDNEFRHLTLQVIAQAVMSLSPEESDRTLPKLYLPIVDEANSRTWHPWRMILPNASYQQSVNQLNQFVVDIITKRWYERQERINQSKEGTLHLDILDRLLEVISQANADEQNNTADQKTTTIPKWATLQLRDEIKTFLLAGHETSSMSLTWALYELTQNPDIEQRLFEEAKEIFPSNDLTLAKPDYTQLRSLTYSEYVLKEALRKYSVVPVVTREAVETRTIPAQELDTQQPITIPKGCSIVIPIRYIHHRKDLWDDPEVFRPERWSESINTWQFLGFLAGPRFCIGQHFALLEAKIVLSMIVRKYHIRANKKTSKATHRYMIPICPLDTMNLEIVPRED